MSCSQQSWNASPPPQGEPDAALRALIFDSEYDSYKGVIAHVRVVDGDVKGQSPLRLSATNRRFEAMEVGSFSPELRRLDSLSSGDVGYVATGLKDVADVRVGDTMTIGGRHQPDPLPGYREPKAMVFAGLYPANSARLPGALGRARQAAPVGQRHSLPARIFGRAGFRIPDGVPGTAAHGNRPGATGARVRTRVWSSRRRQWSTRLRASMARYS